MRALLIVNPRATSISGISGSAGGGGVLTGVGAGRVIDELGAGLELDTSETRYRGHAGELAAAAGGYDLVVTLGGDGTVNEVVNGLLRGRGGGRPGNESQNGGEPGSGEPGSGEPGSGEPGSGGPGVSGSGRGGPGGVPALATVPGGGVNVFARTLGLPPDPVAAASRIVAAARAGTSRTIGLGLATSAEAERYFVFSAGLGVDAEVVADVERMRANGQRESAPLFMWTALRRYFTRTDRRRPALTLEADGLPDAGGLFMGLITNSAPWTYLGRRPVLPNPNQDFNSGLDVFALRRLRTLSTLRALGQMIFAAPTRTVSGRDVVTATALAGLTFQASRPVAFQADGEYLGETERVAFRHLPSALRVIALPM